MYTYARENIMGTPLKQGEIRYEVDILYIFMCSGSKFQNPKLCTWKMFSVLLVRLPPISCTHYFLCLGINKFVFFFQKAYRDLGLGYFYFFGKCLCFVIVVFVCTKSWQLDWFFVVVSRVTHPSVSRGKNTLLLWQTSSTSKISQIWR